MTGVSMELSIDDAAVLAGLDALTDFSRDQFEVMDDVGASMVISTQQRFELGVGPDGTPWKPSARAEEVGGQTLIESARLVQSITHEPGPSDVVWGTDVIYALPHQEGMTIHAKGGGSLRFRLPGGGFANVSSVDLPARPFLGVNDEDDALIGELFIEAILDRYNSAPGGAGGARP